MTLAIHELERTDTRVLGALRCIDATTGAAVDTPLVVQIDGAITRRNRSGLHVIVHVPAMAAHEAAFDTPPSSPPLGSVPLTASIVDPSGRYLPRRATLQVPRDPNPRHANAVATPIDVALYPSATAATGANWAVLRVTASESTSHDALGGALLRVIAGGHVLARGLTDWRGEALLAVPGVPVTTWSDDKHAVVVSEINVQVEIVFDPATGVRTPAAQLLGGHAPIPGPQVDPDALNAQHATLPHASVAATIAAGRSQPLSLPLALP